MSGRGRGKGRAPPSGARLLLQRSAKEAGLDAGNLRSLQDLTRPALFPDYEWHSSGRMGHDAVNPEATATAPGGQAQQQSSPDSKPAAAAKPASNGSTNSGNKRSVSTIYLVNQSRSMHHRFQTSGSMFVRQAHEVDVVRYGKEHHNRPTEPDVAFLTHHNIITKVSHGKKLKTTSIHSDYYEDYFPEELLQTTSRMKNATDGDDDRRPVRSLDELAAAEERKPTASVPPAATAATKKEVGDDGELSDSGVGVPAEDEEEVPDYTINYYESEGDSDGGGDEPTF